MRKMFSILTCTALAAGVIGICAIAADNDAPPMAAPPSDIPITNNEVNQFVDDYNSGNDSRAARTLGNMVVKTARYLEKETRNYKNAPYMSASLKPCIKKYNAGNYVGAMQDLIDVIVKEPNNTYAKYYLALTYTQLGYKEKAKEIFQEVVEGNNAALAYYSQKAITCLDSPDGQCTTTAEGSSDTAQEYQDIENFINSGQKMHPAAQDRIMSEKMNRKIQAESYAQSQKK